MDYCSTVAGASLGGPPLSGGVEDRSVGHPVRLVGHPEVGTHSGPVPIRLGNAGRMNSLSRIRVHAGVTLKWGRSRRKAWNARNEIN